MPSLIGARPWVFLVHLGHRRMPGLLQPCRGLCNPQHVLQCTAVQPPALAVQGRTMDGTSLPGMSVCASVLLRACLRLSWCRACHPWHPDTCGISLVACWPRASLSGPGVCAVMVGFWRVSAADPLPPTLVSRAGAPGKARLHSTRMCAAPANQQSFGVLLVLCRAVWYCC